MDAEWRRGRRLAIDWGKVRVGVAACDPDGLLAHPVETVPNDRRVLERLAELVSEYEPIEVLLGMPVNLAGQLGPAAQAMSAVADRLAARLGVPLRIVDERMSTASAARKLAAGGRNSRRRRSVIDQAAAVDILEQALEYERRTGEPAGTLWHLEGTKDESIPG